MGNTCNFSFGRSSSGGSDDYVAVEQQPTTSGAGRIPLILDQESLTFGQMIFKRPNVKSALIVQTTDQKTNLHKLLTSKFKYDCSTAKNANEIREFYSSTNFEYPILVIIDFYFNGRGKKKFNSKELFSILEILNQLLRDEKTAAVLLIAEKSINLIIIFFETKFSSKNAFFRLPHQCRSDCLIEKGVTKIFHVPSTNQNEALENEIFWMENAILPSLMKLRSAQSLFSALEHCQNPIQITDSSNFVQYVNFAYEKYTGFERRQILNTKLIDNDDETILMIDHQQDPSTSTTTINDQNSHPVEKMENFSESNRQTWNEINRANLSQFHNWNVIPLCGGNAEPPRQLIYIKDLQDITNNIQALKHNALTHRIPSFRTKTLSVDSPMAETIALLKEASSKARSDAVKSILQKAINNLSFTEICSPILGKIKDDDRVACNLLGGLVLNVPLPIHSLHQQRKRSLYDIMKNEWQSKSSNSASLDSLCQEGKDVLELEDGWQFDILALERVTEFRPLVHLAKKIFQRFHICEMLNCPEDKLIKWLRVVENHYHPENPYHNSTHASDVLQAAAYYLKSDVVSNALYATDAASTLIAAVIHDVDHPGRGSSFLINSRHSLAMLYNDVSVLENHHASLAFQLTLGESELNIFENLAPDEYVAIRRSVVDMVLATDMFRHYDYVEQFQRTILANLDQNSTSLPPTSSSSSQKEQQKMPQRQQLERRRVAVCRMLIKCADVSNPSRPWHLCREWVLRIVQEYFDQSEDEIKKGLPLSMDVFQNRQTCNIAETQCKFMDMFAKPMFNAWCTFSKMPELYVLVEKNYSKWLEESKNFPSIEKST